MEKKVITKSVRCEVGENLSHRVYAVTEYPTSAEYTAICVALITKYPVLADTYGNGYVSYFWYWEVFRFWITMSLVHAQPIVSFPNLTHIIR